jgi:cytochrome c oxidase subunit 2
LSSTRIGGSPEHATARPKAALPPRRSRASRLASLSALCGLVLALTAGCSANDLPRLAMPKPITEQGDRVLQLWQGGWIAAFFVGALVWGLIIWCVIAYRKRGEDAPPQLTYNGPIEILYTIVPIIFVAFFFYFTARDESAINKMTPNPDVTVEVVGFQWDWQFNYLNSPDDQTAHTVAQITGDNAHGHPATLILPAGETVRFKLVSPDVVHAFWVPSFLFKRDVIPGRTNEFQVDIKEDAAGNTYIGRCTELCGLNHDQMLFYVKIVDPATYRADLAQMESQFTTGSTT